MDNILQYSVNIAMEATIMFVIIVMLATYIFHRKLYYTAKPFIVILCFILLMLINQIATWILLIKDVPDTYGAMPMRIVYIIDYVLYYGISIAFFHYVEALVKDGYARTGVEYVPKRKVHIAMVAWAIVSAIVYVILLFVPSIYHVENGDAIYSIHAFICMHIITEFACICAVILIIKHRKVMDKHDARLCTGFIILVSVFSLMDELFSLCISYVLLSLFVFILYVRIDLHKELILERQEKEINLWKTQIMLSQMQPHFIYNVLTTISSLCEMENAIQARDVVNRFADYFRTNLDSLGKDKLISFEKELEHIKTYLWLEKIRFEDKLNICYEIENTDFAVPSLTVQPMVENAVKHGILPKEHAGNVRIKTYDEQGNHIIVIEDDGVGFDVNKVQSKKHVGIENVSKRLEMICNGTCRIQSETGKGTVVTITIPKGEQL